MDKQKTSVYLPPEKYNKAKKKAKEAGMSYSDWASDAISSAIANPDFRNPTKPTTEWEKILEKLKEAQHKPDLVIRNIVENQSRLETKINALMDELKVEQPVKDKSGRRIFDE